MREIKMFYRRLNFNCTNKRRLQCEASLKHTFRIEDTTNKELQWREELAHENIIWLNKKCFRLDDLSISEREELLYDIAPPLLIKKRKKLMANRAAYKSKLKKAIETEKENKNFQTSNFLQDILIKSEKGHIPYSRLDKFTLLKMNRKNQRVNMLEKFLSAHNELVNQPKDLKPTYVQEGIFKFPHLYLISTDLVSKQDYIDTVVDFLTTYFSDYEIKCVVCHHDERELNEDTGAHSHYFLSAKNSKTGMFDLIQHQNRVVRKYMKDNALLPGNKIKTYQDTKLIGAYFQRMFYDFVNKHLLAKKGLIAVVSQESEESIALRESMRIDSQRPKHLRRYNLAMRSLEKNKEKLKKVELKLIKNSKTLISSESELKATHKALEEKAELLKQAKEMFDELVEQNQLYKDEIEYQAKRSHGLKNFNESLEDKSSDKIVNICKKIFVAIASREGGLTNKVNQYIEDILAEYKQLLPSSLNKICLSAAQILKDEQLIKGLEAIDKNKLQLTDEKSI